MRMKSPIAPPRMTILRGPADDVAAWFRALAPRTGPRELLFALPNGLALPPALAKPETAQASAWVCEGATCRAPVTTLAELVRP